jgi:hypothetical protein
MTSDKAMKEYVSLSPRKLVGQYWDSHPFVTEYVLYE